MVARGDVWLQSCSLWHWEPFTLGSTQAQSQNRTCQSYIFLHTVLQKTFVASGTLFLPYVFLLNLAAPAAGRVSLLVSLES